MKSRSSLIRFLIPVVIFVLATACQYDVPVKEMAAAKTAIEEAKIYDADKHAPEDLKNAEDLLYKSHEFVNTGKTEEAKQAANDAFAAAVEAEKKALPPYTAIVLKKADDAYAEADQAYAEKFSSEKFAQAGMLLSEAASLNEKTEYKKASESAEQSYKLSVAARDESLQNSSSVESEVKSAEERMFQLKDDKYSSAAESNLTVAAASIEKAKQDIEKKDYKSALKEADAAKKELDTASELIRKQKVTATIQELRNEINGMQGKSEAADVKQDLDNAVVELNGAEASLEQNNITDAELRIDNAKKLISSSNDKMSKQNALAAIDKAEKLLAQAREKDAGKKYSENLDRAGTVIVTGKTAIEAGKFGEGVASAEEAESIINTVLNSLEAAAADLAVKSENERKTDSETKKDEPKKDEAKVEEKAKKETGRIYVVKWRKKNTDCLWRIAETVYKDASYWPAIYLANRDQIKDPDLIFPGQRFSIPPKPQKRPSYKKIREQIKAESEKQNITEPEDKAKEETKDQVKTETKDQNNTETKEKNDTETKDQTKTETMDNSKTETKEQTEAESK